MDRRHRWLLAVALVCASERAEAQAENESALQVLGDRFEAYVSRRAASHDVPLEALDRIATSYERAGVFEASMLARIEAADRVVALDESGHPAPSEDARHARDALHDAALLAHRRAHQMRLAFERDGCVEHQGRCLDVVERTVEVRNAYQLALLGYAAFAHDFPDEPDVDAFTYNRGDALLALGRVDDASTAFASVRDANDDDSLTAAAGLMTVRLAELAIQRAVRDGTLDPCAAVRAGVPIGDLDPHVASACATPPVTRAAPVHVSALSIPPAVQRLIDARRLYRARVSPRLDNEHELANVLGSGPRPPFAPAFAFANARTLVRFGYIDDGERSLRWVLQNSCRDRSLASAAYTELRNLYVLLQRDADRDALAENQSQHGCAGVDPSDDLADRDLRVAMERYQRAAAATAAERLHGFAEAADRLRAVAVAHPQHPDALRAWVTAGLADVQAERPLQAADSFDHALATDGSASGDRIELLLTAEFERPVALEHALAFAEAERAFRAALEDARFRDRPGAPSLRHDASLGLAELQTLRGDPSGAAETWRAFAAVANTDERPQARLNVARSEMRAGRPRAALPWLEPLVATTTDPALRVLAANAMAEAWDALHDPVASSRAAAVIVATARNTPLAPGSAAARAASEVLAARLAHALASVRSASVPSGTPEAIAARFAATEDTLAALDDDAALAFRMAGGAASIDALVLDGEAHETVASIEERAGSGVVATRSRMTNVAHVRAQIARIRRAAASVRPRDAATADRLEAAATRLQEALDTSNATFRDRAQAAMDARAREQRLAAVRAYVVAVRAAAIGHLAGSGVTRAREHLRDDANAELLREALAGVPREVARAIGLRANDPSLAFDTGAAVVTETALTAGAALAP